MDDHMNLYRIFLHDQQEHLMQACKVHAVASVVLKAYDRVFDSG